MSADLEYSSLRQEIQQSHSQMITLSTFIMGFVGSLLTVAFSQRNPIAPLAALLVLYLGHVIVFNCAQTIARISTYLRVFWEPKHDGYQWETRLAKLRVLIPSQAPVNDRATIVGRLASRPIVYEKWLAPLIQQLYVCVGFICIGVAVIIAMMVRFNPIESADPVSLEAPASLLILVVMLAFATLAWTLFWLHVRQLATQLEGRNSLVEQMYAAWEQVQRDGEHTDEADTAKRQWPASDNGARGRQSKHVPD